MHTYLGMSRSFRDAPPSSIMIKLRSKAARISQLNTTTFVVGTIAVIAERRAIEYRKHVIFNE